MIKKTKSLLFWMVSLILILSGCTLNSPSVQTDISPLLETGENCQSPCWMGLQPGISTRSELLSFFEASGEELFTEVSYKEDDKSGRWFDTQTGMLIDISFNDEDKIFYFAFLPYGGSSAKIKFPYRYECTNEKSCPEKTYWANRKQWIAPTLGDIIGSIGIPDSYSANVFYDRHHDEYALFLNLVYTELGIVIHTRQWDFEPEEMNFQPTCQVNISPELNVYAIYFIEVDTVSGQTNNIDITDVLPVDLKELQSKRPWNISSLGTVDITEECLD